MSASLKLTVLRDLSGVGEKTHKLLGEVVRETTKTVVDIAVDSIQHGEKTGRTYIVNKSEGKVHVASAPGEAPANVTSALANSIQGRQTGDLSGEVNVSSDHALIEFGTTTIAPRPYLAPALDAVAPAFEAAIDAAIRKGLG